jgi:hypothetical protein
VGYFGPAKEKFTKRPNDTNNNVYSGRKLSLGVKLGNNAK